MHYHNVRSDKLFDIKERCESNLPLLRGILYILRQLEVFLDQRRQSLNSKLLSLERDNEARFKAPAVKTHLKVHVEVLCDIHENFPNLSSLTSHTKE